MLTHRRFVNNDFTRRSTIDGSASARGNAAGGRLAEEGGKQSDARIIKTHDRGEYQRIVV
jgi:hypothetical protein